MPAPEEPPAHPLAGSIQLTDVDATVTRPDGTTDQED